MNRTIAVTALILATSGFSATQVANAGRHPPNAAKSWQPGRGHDKHKQQHRRGARWNDEVVVIRGYYANRGLPPGLAKRETLPPGLRRQLVVGGHLPPGLEKRLYAVPRDLVVLLPPLPRYQQRFFLGVDLLIVDTKRNAVVDIVADVFH